MIGAGFNVVFPHSQHVFVEPAKPQIAMQQFILELRLLGGHFSLT
jgi:hypothetical protein